MNLSGLRLYQQPHGVKLARALDAFGAALDASDTGTGKTFVALWLARESGAVPLVICPKSVVIAWRDTAKALGVEAEVVNYEKVRGQRRPVLVPPPICELTGKPLYGPYFIRLSQSEWGCEQRAGKKGSRWTWANDYELVIFDEVDRCAGNTSLQSKLLIAARRQAKYVLCLSATAADDPRQFKALGYTLRLFTLDNTKNGYRWWLLSHGCKPGVFGGFEFEEDPEKRRQAMLRIHDEIFNQGRGSRLRKADIPGFPRTQVDVRLLQDETGKAKKLARDLADEFEAGNHLAATTALRQRLELLKVPHLVEMAVHYAQVSRVVIFVNYTETIHRFQTDLGKALKVQVPAINGENNQAEIREDIKRRFQANEIPVLICNSQAGGVGIGLHDPTGQVERTTLISPCYSARIIKQILGRVPRDGGAFSTQLFVYFAETLEAEIAAAVKGKLQNLDALNDATLNGVLQ